MKIGIVCYPTFGGSGVVATELGKHLAQKGHQVHFIAYDQPFRLEAFNENIFYHQVSVAHYPLFEFAHYESALTSKLVDVATFENLDLLHVHYAIPHASAAYMAKKILASKGIHIPIITTLHGTDITLVGKDPSFKPVIHFAMNQSDAITAVSESLKQETLDLFDLQKEIQVIHNFIDLKRYKGLTSTRQLKIKYAPNNERIIMHASNFRKVKRVEDVVRTFKEIHDHLPSKLILIGDGPKRQSIEAMCREMGTCADTIFLGKLRTIEEIFSIGDLFLLPSQKESFGLVALEAMASGMPVISSNVGGLSEVNIDGQTGFLCPVGNTKEMGQKALEILSSNHYPTFKQAALNQARKFDILQILPKYEALYEQLIQEKHKVA